MRRFAAVVVVLVAACGGQSPAATGAPASGPALSAPASSATTPAAIESPPPPSGGTGTATGPTIHVVLTGGPHPGTYDMTGHTPCVDEGGGGWSVSTSDSGGDPAAMDLKVGTAVDDFTIEFADGEGYITTTLEVKVAAGAGAPTLIATGPIDDLLHPFGGHVGTVDVMVQCAAAPVATPFVLPTQQLQGPVPSGATVLHLTIGFGPWAGTYDAWTLKPACTAGDGILSVEIVDASSIPASVSLIVASDESEPRPVGALQVLFGALPDLTIYDTSADATFVFDRSGSAHVVDGAATSTKLDLSTSTGSLEATLACASVSGWDGGVSR